jgi:tRNA pseudouridine55 synthase
LNGILNVNKPSGVTSFGVVAAIKRFTREKHAGHAGTLDPLASGVLPVCLGQSTRLVEYLMVASKTYLAGILLGISTDTLDVEGQVTRQADASDISFARIESVLPAFRGRLTQTVPAYSALKYKGRPLYEYAREGIAVEPKNREVSIYKLEPVDFSNPVLTLRVTCSKGTYIRSLANDIGISLGCGGSLKSLVRENVGPFDIHDAATPDEIKEAFASGAGEKLLLPPDVILQHIPAVVLDEDDAKRVICGNIVPDSHFRAADLQPPRVLDTGAQTVDRSLCRAYSAGGCFLAVMRYLPEEDAWQPEKVFL